MRWPQTNIKEFTHNVRTVIVRIDPNLWRLKFIGNCMRQWQYWNHINSHSFYVQVVRLKIYNTSKWNIGRAIRSSCCPQASHRVNVAGFLAFPDGRHRRVITYCTPKSSKRYSKMTLMSLNLFLCRFKLVPEPVHHT